MTESSEHYVKADAILTEDGFVGNKALHIKNRAIAGFPDNHLLDDTVNVLDYPGHVITPCFCDYHLHFFNNSPEDTITITKALNSSGITAAFEGGDKNCSGLKTKEQFANHLNIKTAGCAIYKKGAYGQYIGKGVESIREAAELIHQLKREGMDYIKVINSGILKPETGEITPGGFEANELSAIMQHAQDSGFKVACHANGEKAVREAVEAGASYIIHGLHVSDETLSMMAEKGTALVPTANAFASLKAIASDKEAVQHIERAVDCQLSAISRAAGLRVTILPGSDSGPDFIPYGRSFIHELQYFHKAGLSIDTILQSATAAPFKVGINAAYAVTRNLEIKKVFIG